MTPNIGTADRLLRMAAGALLLGLLAFGVIGWWGLIGIVLLATSLMSFCPLYRVIGLQTCPKR